MSDLSIPSQHNSAKYEFTELQGQYLAFIRSYTKLHRVAPSEQDMQSYFRVTPPSVHRTGLPPALDAVVARAMHKDIALRYASWWILRPSSISLICH